MSIDQLPDRWQRKIKPKRIANCPVPGSCWLWTGALSSGYGRLMYQKRPYLVHRVVYQWLVGPIPKGLHIDHLCRQRTCCNPRHLEPVTCATNVQRGVRATQTRCKRGHPLSGRNHWVHISAKGTHRICRQCRREYMVGYRAMRKKQREATWAKYLGGAA